MAVSATFQDLSLELVCMIVNHVPDEDMMTLRQVGNHWLHNAAYDRFNAHHFTTMKVTPSRKGLSAIENAFKDPAIGTVMRKVEFQLQPVENVSNIRLLEGLRPYILDTLNSIIQWRPITGDPPIKEALVNLLEACIAVLNTQRNLLIRWGVDVDSNDHDLSAYCLLIDDDDTQFGSRNDVQGFGLMFELLAQEDHDTAFVVMHREEGDVGMTIQGLEQVETEPLWTGLPLSRLSRRLKTIFLAHISISCSTIDLNSLLSLFEHNRLHLKELSLFRVNTNSETVSWGDVFGWAAHHLRLKSCEVRRLRYHGNHCHKLRVNASDEQIIKDKLEELSIASTLVSMSSLAFW